jgi:hypothetical protein
MISKRRGVIGTVAIALLLLVGIAASYGLQMHAASTSTGEPEASATSPTAPASYVYSDATSVQFLTWSETTPGALQGVADEVADLSPGSPTFITSTVDWTGTRTGRNLTISIPGATILATLDGDTLIRREQDPRTAKLVTQAWVRGTLGEYTTLIQAFRDYILLGQDLAAITLAIQTAQQFPNPVLPEQVQHDLLDAQAQLADLQGLSLPHLPGLVTPWVLSPQLISRTLDAARSFLSTPAVS